MARRIGVSTIAVLAVLFAECAAFARDTYVRGYFRSDGAYVTPHYRSAPDSNFYNNWSTTGNINPYTGKDGTVSAPPVGYGSSSYPRSTYFAPSYTSPRLTAPSYPQPSYSTSDPVRVDGYIRKDGAYVQPYYRTAPDSSTLNNWATKGNVNLYSGKEGTREPVYNPGPVYNPRPTYTRRAEYTLPAKVYGASKAPTYAPRSYKPTKTLEEYERESRRDWTRKLKRNWGLTVDPSTTDTLTMIDIDTRHTWARKIRNSWGLSVDPNKTDALSMMDTDTRYRYSYRIKQEFGVRYDPNEYDALTLIDKYFKLRK